MTEIKKVNIDKFVSMIPNAVVPDFQNVSNIHREKINEVDNIEQVDITPTLYEAHINEIKTKYTNEDFEAAVNLDNEINVIISRTTGEEYNNIQECYDIVKEKLQGTVFKNLEGFNEAFKQSVDDAGPGTVNAVVVVAMMLAYVFPSQTGSKFFYDKDFSHTVTRVYEPGRDAGANGIVDGETVLDCRAFVQWVLYNAGFKVEMLDYIDANGDGIPDIAEVAPVIEDVTKVKPGDIFTTSGTGHIWLVVGVTEDGYYAAEENGYNNGAEVNYYSFDDAYHGWDAKAYDMSEFYNNSDNIRDEYKNNYQKIVFENLKDNFL